MARSDTWRAMAFSVVTALAFGTAGEVSALDIDVGQAWTCSRVEPPMSLVYVIGALDAMSDLTPDAPAELRGDRIAHIAVTGIVEADTVRAINVGHLPFAASRLGCSGRRFYTEGALLPDTFAAGYAAWRARAADGGLAVHDLPVDDVILTIEGLLPETAEGGVD